MDHDERTLLGEDRLIIERFATVPKSEGFPSGVSYATVGLVRKPKGWKEIVRIDNAPHCGRIGSHVHAGGKVIFRNFKNQDEIYGFVKACLERDLDTHSG